MESGPPPKLIRSLEACVEVLSDPKALRQSLPTLMSWPDDIARFSLALFELELARKGDEGARDNLQNIAERLLVYWHDGSGGRLAQTLPALADLWASAAATLAAFEARRISKALEACWEARADAPALETAMAQLIPDGAPRVEFARCLYFLRLAKLGKPGAREEFAGRVASLSAAYREKAVADELIGGDEGLSKLWGVVTPLLKEFFADAPQGRQAQGPAAPDDVPVPHPTAPTDTFEVRHETRRLPLEQVPQMAALGSPQRTTIPKPDRSAPRPDRSSVKTSPETHPVGRHAEVKTDPAARPSGPTPHAAFDVAPTAPAALAPVVLAAVSSPTPRAVSRPPPPAPLPPPPSSAFGAGSSAAVTIMDGGLFTAELLASSLPKPKAPPAALSPPRTAPPPAAKAEASSLEDTWPPGAKAPPPRAAPAPLPTTPASATVAVEAFEPEAPLLDATAEPDPTAATPASATVAVEAFQPEAPLLDATAEPDPTAASPASATVAVEAYQPEAPLLDATTDGATVSVPQFRPGAPASWDAPIDVEPLLEATASVEPATADEPVLEAALATTPPGGLRAPESLRPRPSVPTFDIETVEPPSSASDFDIEPIGPPEPPSDDLDVIEATAAEAPPPPPPVDVTPPGAWKPPPFADSVDIVEDIEPEPTSNPGLPTLPSLLARPSAPPPPPAMTPARGAPQAKPAPPPAPKPSRPRVSLDVDIGDFVPEPETVVFWKFAIDSLSLLPKPNEIRVAQRLLPSETKEERKRLIDFIQTARPYAQTPDARAFAALLSLSVAGQLKERTLFGKHNEERTDAFRRAFAFLAPHPEAAGRAACWFDFDGPVTEAELWVGLEVLMSFLGFCARNELDPLDPKAQATFLRAPPG